MVDATPCSLGALRGRSKDQASLGGHIPAGAGPHCAVTLGEGAVPVPTGGHAVGVGVDVYVAVFSEPSAPVISAFFFVIVGAPQLGLTSRVAMETDERVKTGYRTLLTIVSMYACVHSLYV